MPASWILTSWRSRVPSVIAANCFDNHDFAAKCGLDSSRNIFFNWRNLLYDAALKLARLQVARSIFRHRGARRAIRRSACPASREKSLRKECNTQRIAPRKPRLGGHFQILQAVSPQRHRSRKPRSDQFGPPHIEPRLGNMLTPPLRRLCRQHGAPRRRRSVRHRVSDMDFRGRHGR